MILQGAEVVHLGVVGVVQGHLAGAGARPDHLGVGADPGVLATERHSGQQGRRVALADCQLMAELPHRRAQLVDGDIGETRCLLGAYEQPGHHQRGTLAAGDEALDNGDLAVFADVDDQSREDCLVVALHDVADHDRTGVHTAGYRQHGLAVERGTQLVEHIVDHTGVEVVTVGEEPVGALHSGRRCDRVEAIELQVADAAVAPHLLLGRRQRHGLRPLCGGLA